MNVRSGGEVIVELLEAYGINRVFSVPGESFLSVLDALHDSSIQNIVCRHEGGAALMAEAHAKLTGRPGVAIVTRGPGASNAACGVHVASHDSTPMILFVGQVSRDLRGRQAFQEIDIAGVFSPLCKWADEIPDAGRIEEYVHRAMHVAQADRRGPVVLALPEDILFDRTSFAAAAGETDQWPELSAADIDGFVEWLRPALRPMVVVGGSRWSQHTADLLQEFSTRFKLPVATSFRRQDYVDNRFVNYIGDLSAGANPLLNEQVANCDRLLLLGTRFGDIATRGFSCPKPGSWHGSIAHVHPHRAEFNRIWRCDLSLCTTPDRFLRALCGIAAGRQPDRSAWLRSCRSLYANWVTISPVPGAVSLPNIVAWLSDNLPEDAIVTNGAGNYAAFVNRYFRFKKFGTQLAPTSGSMGYGLPAAIAAKLERPQSLVVCIAGDGCFQMTMNELSTAVQHKANIIAAIANNGFYGTIRMHQEMRFPERVSSTDLYNPDYAALARAYGCHGETVLANEDFAGAFGRSVEAGMPAVIELRLDPEAIGTETTISGIRQSGTALRQALMPSCRTG